MIECGNPYQVGSSHSGSFGVNYGRVVSLVQQPISPNLHGNFQRPIVIPWIPPCNASVLRLTPRILSPAFRSSTSPPVKSMMNPVMQLEGASVSFASPVSPDLTSTDVSNPFSRSRNSSTNTMNEDELKKDLMNETRQMEKVLMKCFEHVQKRSEFNGSAQLMNSGVPDVGTTTRVSLANIMEEIFEFCDTLSNLRKLIPSKSFVDLFKLHTVIMDLFDRIIRSVQAFLHDVNDSSPVQPLRLDIYRKYLVEFKRFGTFGYAHGQIREPSGIIADSRGLIVADTNGHTISIFDLHGNYKGRFGPNSDWNLIWPNSIAIDPRNGNFLITERPPGRQVRVYNQDGRFIMKCGYTELTNPRAITVDSDGRILVVECKVMRVTIFTEVGTLFKKLNLIEHLQFPNSICVNDKQEIFISDNMRHCVLVFSYDGDLIRSIGEPGLTNNPIAVRINSQGHVLVADNCYRFHITVFSQAGIWLDAHQSLTRIEPSVMDVTIIDDERVAVSTKSGEIVLYALK